MRLSAILNCPSGNPDPFGGGRSCILRRPGVRNVRSYIRVIGWEVVATGAATLKIAFVGRPPNLKFFWGVG